MPEYMGDGVPEIPKEKINAFAEAVGVTASEIHRFFEATGWSTLKCEVCNQDDFALEVMDGLPAALTLPAAVSSKHAKWVMSLRCNSCGNLKLVDYMFMRSWIRTNIHGD